MIDNTDVRQPGLLQLQQAMSDTRFVDFDAQEVAIRFTLRHLNQQLAVAKADFDDFWRPTTKNGMTHPQSRRDLAIFVERFLRVRVVYR